MVSFNKENNSCIMLCVNAGGRGGKNGQGTRKGGKEEGDGGERERAVVANPHLLLDSGGLGPPTKSFISHYKTAPTSTF